MMKPAERQKAMNDLDAVIDAVVHADLESYPDIRKGLKRLSRHTAIDGIEVLPEGVLLDGDRIRGIFNLHIVLDFGRKRGEGPLLGESLEGRFVGRIEGRKPRIESMSVDPEPLLA